MPKLKKTCSMNLRNMLVGTLVILNAKISFTVRKYISIVLRT